MVECRAGMSSLHAGRDHRLCAALPPTLNTHTTPRRHRDSPPPPQAASTARLKKHNDGRSGRSGCDAVDAIPPLP